MFTARAWVYTGILLMVGPVLGSCGSPKEKAPESPYVGASVACGGLFAGPLASVVESVSGSALFDRTGTKGLEDVTEAIEEGHASGRNWAPGAELCELRPKNGASGEHLKWTFSIYAPYDVGDLREPAGTEYFAMGKQAEADPTSAAIYFECSSPQLKGSGAKPARVLAYFAHRVKGAANTLEKLQGNLRLAHGASLIVVKELGCENNGGLPDAPVLTPK